MKNKIRAVIIDDEQGAHNILGALISEFCPDVELLGNAHSVESGIKIVQSIKPDLVFLDIDMMDGLGFEVINNTSELQYGVIFTTAYSTYAAKAFEYAALHYLLKPIEITSLIESVNRYKTEKFKTNKSQVDSLTSHINHKPDKIHFKINDEITVFELDEILYFSSQEGVSLVYLNNNTFKTLAESLVHYENLLEDNGFYRIHAKHLVNLRSVLKYKSLGRNGTIFLKNGIELDISARRKAGFTKSLKDWTE